MSGWQKTYSPNMEPSLPTPDHVAAQGCEIKTLSLQCPEFLSRRCQFLRFPIQSTSEVAAFRMQWGPRIKPNQASRRLHSCLASQ
eukprot:8925031-Pyramimonas_sp.AAC.1